MMKAAALIATIILLCLTPGGSVRAAGDAERGAKLAATCLVCHGVEDYRNNEPSYRVPKLGGQKAAYLSAAIKGYRGGGRVEATMTAQTSGMADKDIDDLTAYISTLGTETVKAGGSVNGNLDAAAACSVCHGRNGISVSSGWPTLAGQHEDYLIHALNQYRDGTRAEATMTQVAAALTDAEIEQFARYYSSFEGLETTLPK